MGIGGHVSFADGAIEEHGMVNGSNGNVPLEEKAAPLAYYRGQYRHLSGDYQRPSLAVHSNERSD
jgi:hypothetical protein